MFNMISYSISGKVLDYNNIGDDLPTLGFAGRRIELWQRKAGYDELVGSTLTTTENAFGFDVSLAGEQGAAKPVVYFKVFDDSNLMYTLNNSVPITEPVLHANLEEGQNHLDIYIDFGLIYYELDNGTLSGSNVYTLPVVIQILDNLNAPHAHRLIRVELYNNNELVRFIGTKYTTADGYLKFAVGADKALVVLLNNGQNATLKVTVLEGETEVATTFLSPNEQEEEILKVHIDIPDTEAGNSISISALQTQTGLVISPILNAYLATNSIQRLHSVRKLGGLANQPALQASMYDSDRDAIKKLDSHAQFELLSKNYHFNQQIYNAGFTSVYTVSSTERSQFVARLEAAAAGPVSRLDSMRFYRSAYALSALYSTRYTERLVNRFSLKAQPFDTLKDVLDEIDDKCTCDDCETATSPFAYLTDLINYTSAHIVKDYTPNRTGDSENVTLAELESLFCQPFGQLRIACDELHKNVCQYRIAIEVLQKYRELYLTGTTTCNHNTFLQAQRDFIINLYYSLLEQTGTSFFELRDAQNDPDKKAELAEKLAIVPMYGSVDTIDRLFIPPSIMATDTLSAVKLWLERIETTFGFTSVYRQPFDTPAQVTSELELWRTEYLNNKWKGQDKVVDEFSMQNRVILDPDIVSIDDIAVKPSASTPEVYSVWKSRRQYLDNTIWEGIFHHDSFWRKGAVQKGTHTVTVAGDLTASLIPGQKIVILSDTSGVITQHAILTVASVVLSGSDTDITVLEWIPNDNIPDLKVDYLQKIAVSSYTSSTAILATSPPAAFVSGSRFEIIGSGENDGNYTATNVSGSTITVADTLSTAPTANGTIYFSSRANVKIGRAHV